MTPIVYRNAAQAVVRIALLQFAWGRASIVELMERAGLPANVGYFPLRLAPCGDIPGAMAQSLMPFFPSPLVAKLVERSRRTISADDMRSLALDGLSKAATEMYSDLDDAEELVDLLERAGASCDLEGRPLTAAWTSYEWDGVGPRLFGLATVLREHRGEGHWFALRSLGMSGDHAHVMTQLRNGASRDHITHGYTPVQVEEIIGSLEERGFVAGDQLTDAGCDFAMQVEELTDALDRPPWDAIGEDGAHRVLELAGHLPNPMKG